MESVKMKGKLKVQNENTKDTKKKVSVLVFEEKRGIESDEKEFEKKR